MFHENSKLIGKEEKEKQIRKYLNYDKRLNSLDLILWQTDEYFRDVDGRTEQEQNLLGFLEREIHNLQNTVECLKSEFEYNRFEVENERNMEEE